MTAKRSESSPNPAPIPAIAWLAPEPCGPREVIYRASKRAFDLTVASAALTVLSPVVATAAAAVRLSMGSRVLFRQQRPGYLGMPFDIIKLRTMRHADPTRPAASDDQERLTRLGRFLRETSIDELPELWNVIRGDMSLVGPRPLLMHYLERYTARQARRHLVKPGVTGWAQINGRNASSWERKFELDNWYVDHRSFSLDLGILALTVLRVLRPEGVSHPGAATMPEFTGSGEAASNGAGPQASYEHPE